MSDIPAQEYELGTIWVPMYLNGQLLMIPIRPKPIQPNPIKPKPPVIDPFGYDPFGDVRLSDPGMYVYDDDWNPPPPPDGHTHF